MFYRLSLLISFLVISLLSKINIVRTKNNKNIIVIIFIKVYPGNQQLKEWLP